MSGYPSLFNGLTSPQKADGLSDMDLLQYYATEWDRYKKSAGYLNRLFKSLNDWVNSKKEEGNMFSVYRVRDYIVCMTAFPSECVCLVGALAMERESLPAYAERQC